LNQRRLQSGRAVTASLVAALVVAHAPAAAQEAAAGRAKAQACAVCHGAQGLSAQPDAPNLAGQPALYLATQLRAYRSGARRHEVMNVMARPLSDADIADLAAWYAAIEIKVALPP
jgi:cytochrome c553